MAQLSQYWRTSANWPPLSQARSGGCSHCGACDARSNLYYHFESICFIKVDAMVMLMLSYHIISYHIISYGNCALLSCISSKTSSDKTDLCWGLSGSRHFPSVSATCSFQAWDFETVMVGNSVARLEAQRVTTKIFFLEREEKFPCESRLSSCFLP